MRVPATGVVHGTATVARDVAPLISERTATRGRSAMESGDGRAGMYKECAIRASVSLAAPRLQRWLAGTVSKPPFASIIEAKDPDTFGRPH